MPLPSLRAIAAGLLSLATSLCPALQAAPAPAAAPVIDHATLPTARVENTIAAYNSWLNTVEQRHASAGLATALVVNDQVVLERTLGYANAASREPVTPDTVFRLASLSKAFASAMAGVLVDAGRFSWNTPLVKVVPGFQLRTAAATQKATVADILGQRLGLPRNTYDNLLEAGYPYPELVGRLSEVHLRCPVSTCYSYQNIAYSLIGNVIQNTTGAAYPLEVKQRIFQPLGMHTASYGLNGLESSASWARPHRGSAGGWRPYLPNANYYHVAPAAGVNASLRDMEKWLIAQMGGRPDVLPPAMLQVLHAPGISTPSEVRATPWRHDRLSRAYYALGWRVFTYAGQTMIYHAGEVDGYRTMIGFLPKYRAGLVALWNSSSPLPFNLMPMVMDGLLGLEHRDWAGVESHVVTTRALASSPHAPGRRPHRRAAHHIAAVKHGVRHQSKTVAKTKRASRHAVHTASSSSHHRHPAQPD